MSFPQYPEYKESGVEWLGQVPAHWQVKRMRFVATLNPSKSEVRHFPGTREVSFIPMEAVGEEGSLDLSQARPLGEVIDGYTYLSEGDVTFAKITPCFENGKGAIMRGLREGVGFGTTELTVARPDTSQVTGDYLYRVISSRPFRELGESHMYGAGGQKRVPDDFLRNFELAWPPVPEQATIAAFLDHETARIDALVAEQQRLIALLKEKRQAVISHAVTKGLDPEVPMKDSGVEWLGEIPSHWRLAPLKYLVDEKVAGPYGASLTKSMYTSSGYRVYGQQQVIPNDFSRGDYYVSEDKFNEMRRYKVFSGDVLVSVMGTVGRVAVVPKDVEPGIINPRLVRYKFDPGRVEPEFAKLLIMSRAYQDRLQEASQGSTMEGLNMSILGELPIVLPETKTQREIVTHLKSKSSSLDDLIDQANHAVHLLVERRSALISAAVTGKIDVRGWTPPADAAPAQQEARMEAV